MYLVTSQHWILKEVRLMYALRGRGRVQMWSWLHFEKSFLTPFFRFHFSKFHTSKNVFDDFFSGFTFSTLQKIFFAKMLASLHFEKSFWKTTFFPASLLTSLLYPSPLSTPCALTSSTRAFYNLPSQNHIPVCTFSIVYEHNICQVHCEKVKEEQTQLKRLMQ